jgi:hypothetical protein
MSTTRFHHSSASARQEAGREAHHRTRERPSGPPQQPWRGVMPPSGGARLTTACCGCRPASVRPRRRACSCEPAACAAGLPSGSRCTGLTFISRRACAMPRSTAALSRFAARRHVVASLCLSGSEYGIIQTCPVGEKDRTAWQTTVRPA